MSQQRNRRLLAHRARVDSYAKPRIRRVVEAPEPVRKAKWFERRLDGRSAIADEQARPAAQAGKLYV